MHEQQAAPFGWPGLSEDPFPPPPSPSAVIHFTLYLPDGRVISSHETGSPFRFHPNEGEVIPGLEQAVASMQVGETRRIRLAPRQGFGAHRPDRVVFSPHGAIRSPVALSPGMPVRLSQRDGAGLQQAFVREVYEQGVVFDLNHPLAGVDLTVDVTLVAYE